MTPKISLVTAVASAILVIAVPVAWGKGQPYRDAGDATAARLSLGSTPAVASGSGWGAEWSQLGLGLGIGRVFVLCVIVAVRLARSHRLAH